MTNTARRRGGLCRLLLAVGAALTLQAGLGQDFIWAPDYPVGAEFPAIEAQDQDGNSQDLEDLMGDNGLFFMFSRSFDW